MQIHAFQWLALSYFGYYIAYAIFVPFFPSWLESHAYSTQTIGILLAANYIFRFAGGMFFASRIKLASQLPNMLRLLAWGMALLSAFMGVVVENTLLLILSVALFAMSNSAGMALTDTLATTWQKQIHLDYGKARLIGSGAFVLGVTVFGAIIGWLGNDKIIWILTVLLICYGATQMLIPLPTPQNEPHAHHQTISFSTLLRDPTTLRLLLTAACIQGSHAMYYGYSVIYWQSLGISLSTTSLLWGTAVIAEIGLFFFSSRWFKHWKIAQLLTFAALAAILRWSLLSIATNLPLIALAQLMHSLTFALTHYTIMRYISVQSQSHIAKLQGLYNSIASCMGVALLTALAGFLYPISPILGFIAMAIIAAIGLLLIPRNA